MSRLPYLRREQLDDTGAALWESITSTRGSGVVNDEGGLAGPFNAWLHAPELGTRLAELGTTLRFGMSLDRRLIELAIITVGARWKAEFEWWAHSRMAREHGVPDPVIEAVGSDRQPDFDTDEDRVVHAVARQLSVDGRVDGPTYSEARALLGDRSLVELVSLCGYYTLVSFTLNAFDVPLPAGVQPRWPAARR
ncbi:MAG TPA: carboxymuconolactone decarboxylase family protein [Acidimicrobiales bacterium]|nr:carboxymuconolactone decarboxylase family protein [Acidimicrobiales bacterium]